MVAQPSRLYDVNDRRDARPTDEIILLEAVSAFQISEKPLMLSMMIPISGCRVVYDESPMIFTTGAVY